MNTVFIDPIGLFRVLHARAERRPQHWILSGGRLRNLDRLGEVIQPAPRRNIFRQIKTIVRGYLRR
jgi:hypothetical protein